MSLVSNKSGVSMKDRTIVYCLGIYINPGMRNLLLEYLKRAAPNYKAIRVMFCYWWPGVDREPFVDMVNGLGIENLSAHEFSIMASPAYGKMLGWPGANWPNAIKTTLSEVGKMSSFMKENSADLVHIILTEYQSSWAFARAAKLAKVKSRLLSFTGVAPNEARFRQFMNSLTDKNLTGVLLASKADIEPVREQFPASELSVVYGWGLAPDLFGLANVNPAKIRDELCLDPGDLMIGTTTRIAENKGQETLIRALPKIVEKYPGITCVILGGRYDADQGERARLEERAAREGRGKEIHFHGRVPPEEAAHLTLSESCFGLLLCKLS